MSDELRRSRIREARGENLMILYVDSFRHDDRQTDFYHPRSGGLGRRDYYPPSFLRQRRNRLLLRHTFEGGVQYLATNARWQALHWLHNTFPEQYLRGVPQAPLGELRQLIQRAARQHRIGDHTGWDEIIRMPARLRMQRREEATAARNERRVRAQIVPIIRRELRRASGQEAHLRCFSSVLITAPGGHTNMGPTNWAAALLRFVVTLNELRQGQRPSRSGPIRHAPVTLTAGMVGAATRTWHRVLNDEQRAVLQDDRHWAQVMRPVWEEVQQRIRWGIREAGQPTPNLDTFDLGRWRNPPQSCF